MDINPIKLFKGEPPESSMSIILRSAATYMAIYAFGDHLCRYFLGEVILAANNQHDDFVGRIIQGCNATIAG